jgi:hypothetical protein
MKTPKVSIQDIAASIVAMECLPINKRGRETYKIAKEMLRALAPNMTPEEILGEETCARIMHVATTKPTPPFPFLKEPKK